jgi:hypothetical protein
MDYNLVRNQTRDYKIARTPSWSAICNHKFDFRPNLHDTKFNDHFIIFILKSHKNKITQEIYFIELKTGTCFAS